LIFSFCKIFFNGINFWNHPSFSGEPHIAEANRLISFDIMFASSRIVIGVFAWSACAIFLWSLIFASTGNSDIISISFRLYSCFGERILFTMIPSIGVFCSLAILAAFSVVVSVTLSGDVTRKILSAAAITGFSSS